MATAGAAIFVPRAGEPFVKQTVLAGGSRCDGAEDGVKFMDMGNGQRREIDLK